MGWFGDVITSFIGSFRLCKKLGQNSSHNTVPFAIWTSPIIHFVCPQNLALPLYIISPGISGLCKKLGRGQGILWKMYKWRIVQFSTTLTQPNSEPNTRQYLLAVCGKDRTLTWAIIDSLTRCVCPVWTSISYVTFTQACFHTEPMPWTVVYGEARSDATICTTKSSKAPKI